MLPLPLRQCAKWIAGRPRRRREIVKINRSAVARILHLARDRGAARVESEERYRALFDEMDDAVLVYHTDGRLLHRWASAGR